MPLPGCPVCGTLCACTHNDGSGPASYASYEPLAELPPGPTRLRQCLCSSLFWLSGFSDARLSWQRPL